MGNNRPRRAWGPRRHCPSFAGDSPFGSAISLIVWVYGAVAGLSIYVFMGWLQQTLLMLIGIAKNTATDNILSRL
ncbi:MAG: hypothetical protein ACXVGR_06300 [Mycobacteriaceae bacterium]